MTWNSLEMYTNGLDFFTVVVEHVAADQWHRDTACEGWTALDVIGHVGEATGMGARILRGEDMSFTRHDPPSSIVDGDPASWWAALAADARDALTSVDDLTREVDSPMGKRTVAEGLSFPAVDLFIHGWDLATATGEPVKFPGEAIEFTRAVFDNLPDGVSRRPGVFGPARSALGGANPTEELIAWTGRDPGWMIER